MTEDIPARYRPIVVHKPPGLTSSQAVSICINILIAILLITSILIDLDARRYQSRIEQRQARIEASLRSAIDANASRIDAVEAGNSSQCP